MATEEDDDVRARQSRLENMRSEFRAAQQRRLVKRGIALWSQTEASAGAAPGAAEPSTAKDETS